MKSYQLLFLLACAAAAVPFILALLVMSVEDWKKTMVVVTGKVGDRSSMPSQCNVLLGS